MRIVYLDQNKWVALAQAVKRPEDHSELQDLLPRIVDEVARGSLVLPLSATTIYETFKINNPERRHDLAYVQSTLSQGVVLRGRNKRLEIEIAGVLRKSLGLKPAEIDRRWFLSNLLIEAFADIDDPRIGMPSLRRAIELIRRHPAAALYNYLTTDPTAQRQSAVAQFSAGSEELRKRVEARRRAQIGEALSMRRRIYSALLAIDELDLILRIARETGIACRTISDIGANTVRRLAAEVPAYHVEREIVLRLEAQDRPIHENDFRDMQAFSAAVPYVDTIVAENQFVNLARQAGLDRAYDTRITTKMTDLLVETATGT